MLIELVAMAEESFELDFDAVFRWGLGDDEPAIRAICVEGLWENEDLSLMDRVLDLLQIDPADEVRAAAASSLGRFVLLSELGKLPMSRTEAVYEAVTIKREEPGFVYLVDIQDLYPVIVLIFSFYLLGPHYAPAHLYRIITVMIYYL